MRTYIHAAILIVMGVAACAPPPAAERAIRLEDGAFRVEGWAPPRAEPAGGWGSILAVRTGGDDLPPLLGAYAVEDGALVFRPRFPFEPGVEYRAAFQPPDGGPGLSASFTPLERDTTPVARVTAVYPSADVLPSNQLRLYIYFSEPMSSGEADARIHVLDGDGTELAGILLPGEELWDPEGRRLTMTFDPGRIKRGLTSNVTVGPPIVEGESYTLLIDREWPDARGVPMVEAYRKAYRGGPAVRTTPDPADWTVAAPTPGTRDALVVAFPAPMNYPLLQRMLTVAGPAGEVAGVVDVARNETEWRFTPALPWAAGGYRIVVDRGLEDLAGNSIAQPFDIDVFERVTERIESSTTDVPFTIR